MTTPSYNPPTSPNITMNFVVTPYNPPTSPNVTMNFGAVAGGTSGGGSAVSMADFFLVL